jgi:hypothetical protein
MQKIQILFPNPLMGKVRAVAYAEDRPVSEVIRRAAEKFLDIKSLKTFSKSWLPAFHCGNILVFPEKNMCSGGAALYANNQAGCSFGFFEEIAQSDPQPMHVVIIHQAGFHMKKEDQRSASNIGILPLRPYDPEPNAAEWFGRVIKAPTVNRIYDGLEQLANHIIAVVRSWGAPSQMAALIHKWMRDQVNAIATT